MLVKPTPNEIAILAHEIGRVFGTMEDWLVREIVEIGRASCRERV